MFTTAYLPPDAVVVADAPFGVTGAAKQPVPASVLDTVRALPQVAPRTATSRNGQITDTASVPIGAEDILVLGIPTGELDATNPLRLTEGSWPTGSRDIVVDEATATDAPPAHVR